MGRKLRTTLPSLPNTLKPNWDFIENFRKIDSEFKQNQKLYHDRRHRANDLPILSPHDFVDVNDRNIRKKGQILKSNNTPRSYVVQTESNIITRNCKHLTAISSQQNVSRERRMDATSLSNERNEPRTFDSTKQTADVYVTRYRRTVKKPDRLNYSVECCVGLEFCVSSAYINPLSASVFLQKFQKKVRFEKLQYLKIYKR